MAGLILLMIMKSFASTNESLKLLILTGASGAGKTTIAKAMAAQRRVECLFFDSIGVPSEAEMIEQFGSGEQWQRIKTLEWLMKIKANYLSQGPVLFEGQSRIAFLQEGLLQAGITESEIVLVDCDDVTRHHRLVKERGRPDQATMRMVEWARHLREEAQAAGIRRLDTTGRSLTECTQFCESLFESG